MSRDAKNTKRVCAVILFSAVCLVALCATVIAQGPREKAKERASARIAEERGAVPTSGMDALTAIFTRRSIRKYTNQPVSDETVKTLLQAAMVAPSARNEQPWEFIVIRDKKILDQVTGFHPFAKHVAGAPVAIVVAGNTKLEAEKGLWALDCSNATMNILLAAHSLGLGAVWTTLYPYKDRMDGARTLLAIPDHVIPLAIIPIGYPGETKPPAIDRFNPERIHKDKW